MSVLTDNMTRLIEEIGGAGRSSRKEMLYSIKNGIAALKTDVGEMLSEFRKTRTASKARMRQELFEFTSRLHSFADDLGQQVIDMRKGFHRERTLMITKMDDNLKQFMTGLKNDVAQMKTRTGRHRAESQNRTRTDIDAPAGQPETHTRKEDFEHDRDDLTRIPGIGSHREKLFNQAGIQSFDQLAQCTPGQLKQILGRQGRMVKVETLIAQARSMAR